MHNIFKIKGTPVTIESRKTKHKFLKINVNNFDEVFYFKRKNGNIIVYTVHSSNVGSILKIESSEDTKYRLSINKEFKKYINIIALSFIVYNQLEKERKS